MRKTAFKIGPQTRERFFARVKISETGCHLWDGPAVSNRVPYGRFNQTGAHRWAWFLHFGDIPSGKQVCHTCDVPKCVNPQHLFLGTAKLNAEDRVAKGRNAKAAGEFNGYSKLTAEDVRRIRCSSKSTAELAREMNVTYANVWAVRKNLSWRHV